MGAPITPRQKTALVRLWEDGLSIKAAAAKVGVSYSWARSYLTGYRTANFDEDRPAGRAPMPKDAEKLRPEARQALSDFAYFRLRYLGHVSTPWQVEAANLIVSALETPNKEFVVINVSPGSGKTTLVHDLALWVTCRNRALRGLMGSGTQSKATKMLDRVRRNLTRTLPVQAEDNEKRLGLAQDAEATLTGDFGAFRPTGDEKDVWRREGFVVAQPQGRPTDDKEFTWTAFGLDQDFLGERYDLVIWDDATEPADLKNAERIADVIERYDKVAESRLEPGGLMLLVGQRIGANDLYRHCLDKVAFPEDDAAVDALDEMSEAERTAAIDGMPRKYAHVIYRAHDEGKCTGEHRRDSPAWPEGCLLDPRRLPWSELRAEQYNDPAKYAVWYQQEDADPVDTLVKKVWVEGGTDPDTGIAHIGCRDLQRGLCELPEGLVPPFHSIVSVDPSPTAYWGVHWYIYTPQAADQLFLMDLFRGRMGSDDFLDFNSNRGAYTGLLHDWWLRSRELGLPISHVIIEKNLGSQLFQYDSTKRWRQMSGVNFVEHLTTGTNKADPNYGVDMLRDWFRSGRIRLPWRHGDPRFASMKLVNEVTRYPQAATSDQVMALWFAVLKLPSLFPANVADNPDQERPSWAGLFTERRLAVV